MTATKNKRTLRSRRQARIRTRISGTDIRPRFSVFKSNKFIYAQLIDDVSGKTLLSASSLEEKGKTPRERAKNTGMKLAKLAKEKNVTTVVFDRGGNLYTGNVEALADGAREGGLKF